MLSTSVLLSNVGLDHTKPRNDIVDGVVWDCATMFSAPLYYMNVYNILAYSSIVQFTMNWLTTWYCVMQRLMMWCTVYNAGYKCNDFLYSMRAWCVMSRSAVPDCITCDHDTIRHIMLRTRRRGDARCVYHTES